MTGSSDRALRVSVVIPAHNAAGTIRAAVDSALTQTLTEIEVIVVDDASTDATAAVVETIADPRVKLLRRERNAGSSATRNAGIAAACGTWVGFLDADDVWLPRKLEVQLRAMDAVPGCLASQVSAYMVDADLKPLALRRCVPDPAPLLTFLRFQNMAAACSSWVVDRALLNRVGGFDPDLVMHEDWDLILRITPYAKPISIPEPLTLYRQHPGNRSRDVDSHVDSGLRILARVFADPTLPAEIRACRREIYARYYTMLCGGMFLARRWRGCAWWGARALFADPRRALYMLATPFRRRRRHTDADANPPAWAAKA